MDFERLLQASDWIPALVAAVVMMTVFSMLVRLRRICPPNKVLILSGGKSRVGENRRGYRPIFGGAAFEIPWIRKVDVMSMNVIEVPISVRGAYSKGGIPLAVNAIANVKVSNDPKLIGNAIERFLGRDQRDIQRVAKETLEGHLRGVLAKLTPEEVNQDRLRFAEELGHESISDLNKLGIQLETLKIQHVSDEVQYLDSIGREAIANVIRDAEMAESDARREAELAEAENRAKASVTEAQVEAQVRQMENDLRRVLAELEAEVKSEEERVLAAARQARAEAEQELQRIRAELEGIRLRADRVLPAEADREAEMFRARGEAALVRERGVAVSEALRLMNEAWDKAGEDAMSIQVLEDIEKILHNAAKGVAKIQIDSINMVDGGDGKVLANYISAYPDMLNAILQSVAKTTGIDVAKALSGKSNQEVQP
ncbi:MAG: flotillin family protein [Nitrospirae bacterium]|nr:flotillin family protein [Fimbriimonadaceae bacterium]